MQYAIPDLPDTLPATFSLYGDTSCKELTLLSLQKLGTPEAWTFHFRMQGKYQESSTEGQIDYYECQYFSMHEAWMSFAGILGLKCKIITNVDV